jgi:choline-sulfatase
MVRRHSHSRGFSGQLLVVFALAIPAFAAAAERQVRKPSLLLITLDTTRADHLGCYGNKSAKTPTLDAIAAGGALFEQAHTHVPLTLPSHAVLLSGQLPSTLNLRVNGLRMRDGVDTLATHLTARGYVTAAVVGAVILNREYGLSRGFATYDDHMTVAPRRGGAPEERHAEEVTEAALKVADDISPPFFLWVHYYDPHYEYRPPEPYATEFRKNLYDGEIAYMDASIGALLTGLRRKGLLDNALIVVAADHGEGLFEHGERQHGIFLYENVLRVPLLMNWKVKIRPGSKIKELCGLADVAPTILDLMGESPLPKTDGMSLKPLLDRHTMAPRDLYAESYHGAFTYGWAPLRATINERWKFIEAPHPELYEWRLSERKNLYDDNHPEVRAARIELQRHPMVDDAEAARTVTRLEDPNRKEARQQLMSLGY